MLSINKVSKLGLYNCAHCMPALSLFVACALSAQLQGEHAGSVVSSNHIVPVLAPAPTPTARLTCKCDPMLTPSKFTRCHEGTDKRLHVTHETNHIYRHDGIDNQHVCRMASGVCQCCDCLSQSSLAALPDEMHVLPVGTYTMRAPFLAQGQTNRKKNLTECLFACAEDERCTTGTFILRGSDKGQCWLSRMSGKRQQCTEPCQSFVKGGKR